MLVGIRPGDAAYVDHTGADYHPQDESDDDLSAYYDILNTGDEIIFDVAQYKGGLKTPVMTLHTAWGATDFDLIDQINNEIVVSEQSGFSNDRWFIELEGTSGQFVLTEFDTGDGVDGTQAAVLPYVGITNLKV